MKLPYYHWYPKDFHSDPNVKRLTPLARGCYRDILDFMWMSQFGYMIPDNDKMLCVQLDLKPSSWRKIKEELMQEHGQVFLIENGFLVSNRLKEEYYKACQIVETNSQSGKSSAAARKREQQAEFAKRQESLDFDDSIHDSYSGVSDADSDTASGGVTAKTSKYPSIELPEKERVLGGYDEMLPTNKFMTKGEMYIVTDELVERMRKTYTGVDVDYQFKRLYAWLAANATRRKTLQGMPRFIDAWMAKEQNSGGGYNGTRQSGYEHSGDSRSRGRTPSLDRNRQDNEEFLRKLNGEHAPGRPGRTFDGETGSD